MALGKVPGEASAYQPFFFYAGPARTLTLTGVVRHETGRSWLIPSFPVPVPGNLTPRAVGPGNQNFAFPDVGLSGLYDLEVWLFDGPTVLAKDTYSAAFRVFV